MKRTALQRKTPLRSTGFAKPPRLERERTVSRLYRVPAPFVLSFVPAPKEAVTAKPGKGAPTVEESRWMDAIVAYGCIACRLDGMAPRPTAVHHILRGGQRIGHRYTLPLCDPGHHKDGQAFGLVSRHPWKARFEKRYGNELDLHAKVEQAIGWSNA